MTLIHIRTATKTVIKIIKQYEQETYQAYKSVSGKSWKEMKTALFSRKVKIMMLMRLDMLMSAQR